MTFFIPYWGKMHNYSSVHCAKKKKYSNEIFTSTWTVEWFPNYLDNTGNKYVFYCTLMEQVLLSAVIQPDNSSWLDWPVSGAWRVWLNSTGVVGRNAWLRHKTLKVQWALGQGCTILENLFWVINRFLWTVQWFISSQFRFSEVSNLLLIHWYHPKASS